MQPRDEQIAKDIREARVALGSCKRSKQSGQMGSEEAGECDKGVGAAGHHARHEPK